MSDIITQTAGDIADVRALEVETLKLPQVHIETSHVLHAGVYARSIMLPAGTLLTGALIKCATVLIIRGNVVIYLDGQGVAFSGYNVLPAAPRRKMAIIAETDTDMTMLFATNATTIAEAEDAFTDEAETLISRRVPAANRVLVTGA